MNTMATPEETRPKLAFSNLVVNPDEAKDFATKYGFDGVEWTISQETLPKSPSEESALMETISHLHPLEIRFHGAFRKMDIGDKDPVIADEALQSFKKISRIVSKLQGRYLTIHLGLGLDTTTHLSWERSVERLAELVIYSNSLDVHLCLENLGWGWTSRPELYEKLIRKTGAWATLDIGHAMVSPSVRSQQYTIEDFVSPHPDRFLGAHIYHEEKGKGHMPPKELADLKYRLELVSMLPLCDWWVLELHQKKALLATLNIVREFLN